MRAINWDLIYTVHLIYTEKSLFFLTLCLNNATVVKLTVSDKLFTPLLANKYCYCTVISTVCMHDL